ncbi:Peptidylprolyl isomerase, FKBP-type [hydrothermal vent metagenome]|uniref:peptidylprolyl isomerase n=1 Tax=hydrothermal vent metagenome TaxID=652676 RepID=A0A3B0YXH5_9ZZZZ
MLIKRICLISLITSFMVLNGCSDSVETKSATEGMMEFVKTDIAVGHGAEVTQGDTVAVHYTGWLYDDSVADKKGQQFDSSRDRGSPFEFPLGAGRVIKGWDQGVEGMKVGGRRILIIPSNLGYGKKGSGRAIPPNATLVFDVELLDVR